MHTHGVRNDIDRQQHLRYSMVFDSRVCPDVNWHDIGLVDGGLSTRVDMVKRRKYVEEYLQEFPMKLWVYNTAVILCAVITSTTKCNAVTLITAPLAGIDSAA